MAGKLTSAMPAPLPIEELQRMLLDIDVPDAALRPYVIEASGDSGSFRPSVRLNPALIARGPTGEAVAEAAVALSSLNGISRWRRQQRYRRKITNWSGLRIVSEGDSWYQYPFLLDDVIDQLWDDYAIFSLDAAGDLLTDMVKQGEVVAAVIAEKPDVVLLSGGGNDLLGDARLARVLLPYDESRAPADYLGEAFTHHLMAVLAAYEQVIDQIRAVAPNTAIVCHTYDYAMPNKGRWLGKPMASIGIVDPTLQRAIVRLCIDRFHDALKAIVDRHRKIAVVDSRGAVATGDWFDELHPSNHGFASVAQRFRAAIATAAELVGGAEAHRPLIVADAQVAPGKSEDVAAAAIYLSERFADASLMHELGRREAIRAAGGDTEDLGSLSIPESSVEAFYPVFREAGAKVVEALHRQLFALICGDGEDDKADRKAIGDALRLGQGALVGAIAIALGTIAIPAAIAAIAAPIIARRVFAPSVEAMCGVWRTHFGDDGDG